MYPKPPTGSIVYLKRGEKVTPPDQIAKYFLVVVEYRDPPIIEIRMIDSRDAIERVNRWLTKHCGPGNGPDPGARIPQTLPWHNELVQVDNDGRVGSYSYLDFDLNRSVYQEIIAMFRGLGKVVGTIPNRKPPKTTEGQREVPIDWEGGEALGAERR